MKDEITRNDPRHDSAVKHVTGRAEYADDIPEPAGTLHAYLGLSERAHARVRSIDLSAVREAAGVVGVLTVEDIPGENDVSPTGLNDEPVFAGDIVQFWGQPMFAVVAETRDAARRAAKLARVDYEDLPHVLDAAAAREADYPYVTAPLKLERGDVGPAFDKAAHRIKGRMRIGGQDHMYLEGHIAFAIPGEDEDVIVHSSTQHPSEAQHMVAKVLGVNSNAVTVNVRRMGGGFGGKETQMNLFCAVAAMAAKKWNRAVKIRPDRDDDMSATGKRHDFVIDYDVAFDDEGRIQAVAGDFAARCGFSSDLSGPVTDRALFHADNAYYYPNVRLVSHPMKTNTVSNTAFRGFGGPQGVIAAERIMEEIAYKLGKDSLDVRRANFYGTDDRNVTPYHQTVEDNIVTRVVGELEQSADYRARREAVLAHNARGGITRKGIALTPVKFGISFTATWYNQAGSLVHVYNDGSIALNHGGTEMGQGLNTKVAQVAADAFGVDFACVKITRTTTEKVPNTSATAASSGSDLNGMAALDGCEQIKARLVAFAAEKWQAKPETVRFADGHVHIGAESVPFPDFIKQAYMARVQLSAAGFYKTPKIHWDRATGKGRPFYYYAYGAACSRGDDRHADGRIPGRAHRYPARRRPLPERRISMSARSRALSSKAWVGSPPRNYGGMTEGPASHPCAFDRQDPACLRPSARLQRGAGRLVGEPREHDQAVEGRGRAALHARDFGLRGACRWRSPASPTTRPAPGSTRPATPERVLLAVERLRGRLRP